MLKNIENKEKKINCLHNKIKELNKLDEPSFFNDVFQSKKIEEHSETMFEVENVKMAIEKLTNELADSIITNRDSINFDFRIECAKALSKYGIFELVRLLSSEDEILKACHKKVDRTIMRIESGYYEKV